MLDLIFAQAPAALNELPFLALQGSAVVGIVSVLILLRRGINLEDKHNQIYYGLVFGCAAFILHVMVAEFITLPYKPYIRTDLLFLAAVLGGWRGGLICLVITSAGRFIYGGVALFSAALLDMSVLSVIGMIVHLWVRKFDLVDLRRRDVFGIFVGRIFAGVVGASSMYVFDLVDQDLFVVAVSRRISGSIIALPMITCLFLVLRSEARARAEVTRREQAAQTDPLTGLPNRRALTCHIEMAMQTEPVVPRTIILVEISNIAHIAAYHGEDWGDLFWPRLADDVQNGESGLLFASYEPRSFMFGDSTLAIVMNAPTAHITDSTALMMRLHDMLTAFSRFMEDGPVPHLRIGVTNLDSLPTENVTSVLRYLSLALRGSENPVQIFPHSFAEKATLDELVRQMLMEWIKYATPPICYQPKYAMRERRMIGAEALLRAVDADGEPLSPYYILEIAERHRLLLELEWSTIEAVVRDLRDTKGMAPDFHLAVNISASSFATARFGARVAAFLQEMDVPAHRLSIEVTETSRMPTIDIVQQNFDALTQAGVRLSLDDFGTGYAALTLLARFPFAEVKVDHWMTARLDQSRFRQAIALAFESAERYGAKLVTEGIETEEQSQLLIQMGIEIGQGYLYSPAVPLHRLLPG